MAERVLTRIGWSNDAQEYRPPQNRDELALYLKAFFGLAYPRKAVCPGHTAPFEALAEAYFAEAPVAIWVASRGFGGKTVALAGLSLMELLAEMDVSLLGGSGEQSARAHKATREAWDNKSTAIVCGACRELNFNTTRCVDCGRKFTDDDSEVELEPPRDFLKDREPLVTKTVTIAGAEMQALTASQKSVRGPHPLRLRMDEADEMDIRIIDAAMGQTMKTDPDRDPQIILASTHHRESGTMTELLKRAAERGWPVRRWCYRETLVDEDNPGSWLLHENIAAKRNDVTSHMWRVEYDLEPPSEGGTMFSKEKVDQLFYGEEIDDKLNQLVLLEDFDPRGDYVTSADWGRKSDLSVIATTRYDVSPPRLVAWIRMYKQPWPVAIAQYNKLATELYPGKGIHDATGLGDVVAAYIDVPDAVDFIFSPATKVKCYMDYEVGVDKELLKWPRLRSLVELHLYLQRDDLYGGGHPPDEICSLALNWQIAGKVMVQKKKKSGVARTRSF